MPLFASSIIDPRRGEGLLSAHISACSTHNQKLLGRAVEYARNKTRDISIVDRDTRRPMLLLALVVGMIAYVIVRLQMINLELTWLRQYVMRLLTREVASVGSTTKSDDEIDEVRSVDEEEGGCAWNGDPGQCSMDGVLHDAVGVEAVLANSTAFVVVQESVPPSANHEERITEIEDLQEEHQKTSTACDDENESDHKDAKSEHPSDSEDETNGDSSKEPLVLQESFVGEEDPVDEDAAVTRSDHSRSSRRKGRSRK